MKFSLFCETSLKVKGLDGTRCDMKWHLFKVYTPVRRGLSLFLQNMVIRHWGEQSSSLPFSSTNKTPYCSIELLPPLSCISLHKPIEFMPAQSNGSVRVRLGHSGPLPVEFFIPPGMEILQPHCAPLRVPGHPRCE